MKKADPKAGELAAGKKKESSMVSDDKDWRTYVASEIKGVETWNQDWGFLV